MKKVDIKTIMIVHSDNDFTSAWNWLGNVVLESMNNITPHGEEMLEDSNDIERFVKKLIPIAIEFAQYKTDKYKPFPRYRNINENELISLTKYFDDIKFKYNFDKLNDDDYIFAGSESLIIDFQNNESYTW